MYRGIIVDVEAPLQVEMSDQTMARFRDKEILVEAGDRGQSSLLTEARAPLVLLISITGIVLLIACANIANLLLARGARRGAEMAIRGSIGGSRPQLVGQLLTEAVVLALMGGAASLIVAQWTLTFIGSFLPPEALDTVALQLQPSVILFAAGVAIATAVLFGLYPALHSTRPDLVTLLKNSAGQPSGARSAARFRTSLVTAQLALSMTLLVAAGLFIRSLINVSQVDLGIETAGKVTFRVSPERNGYGNEETMAFFERAEEALTAYPGVTGVSASVVALLAGNSWRNDVRVEGFEWGPDVDDNSRMNIIGTEYFSTLGIPLLAGREFTLADSEDAPGVVIINEAFAAKFGLDTREAVGKRMSQGGEELDLEIVGVIEDAKYSDVKQAVPPVFYRPYRQYGDIDGITFYASTAGDANQVYRAIPDIIGGLDPNLPVENLMMLEDQAEQSVFLDLMISQLASAFAVLATLLAAVGLYGVLAYTVAQRTREIGLRMALGANGSTVRGMVLRQVGRMTIVGAVLGGFAAVWLGRAASSLLFELEALNPVVFAFVAVLLAGRRAECRLPSGAAGIKRRSDAGAPVRMTRSGSHRVTRDPPGRGRRFRRPRPGDPRRGRGPAPRKRPQLDGEPCTSEGILHLLRREQPQPVLFTSSLDAAGTSDQVLELQHGFSVLHQSPGDPGYFEILAFAGQHHDPPVRENTRLEPRLDEHDSPWADVLRNAGEGVLKPLDRPRVPDCAEQAQDDVVLLPEREVAHVSDSERALGTTGLSGAHEGRVQGRDRPPRSLVV